MEHKENEVFHYSYSGKEQEEIKAIRKKYTSPEHQEDKLEKLRRLDSGVTNKATTVSLVFGILGLLSMGFGMSLTMTDLAQSLGLSGSVATVAGIVVGVVGIALMGLSYPVYNRILMRERAKIAPEIFRLTDDLMK